MSDLLSVWNSAEAHPFAPVVPKSSQSAVAFVLLLTGIALTGLFALGMSTPILIK